MRILELFSGIGGMRAAANEVFSELDIAATYEINPTALHVYSHNFGEHSKVQPRNIMNFAVKDLEDLQPDLIMMSPPCQPFTRQGLKQDTSDNRCEPFVHILSILESSEFVPMKILLENVVGFEDSIARTMFISVLKKRGYTYQEFLLSPKQFGIPNSRRRYYLLASMMNSFRFPLLNEIHTELPVCLCLQDSTEKLLGTDCYLCKKPFLEKLFNLMRKVYLRFNPNSLKFSIDKHPALKIEHFVDDLKDSSLYSVKKEQLIKYATVFDIVNSDSEGSCCFTSGYGRFVQGTGSLLHSDPSVNLNSTYDEISTVDPRDPSYYERLHSLKLRYFAPQEILRLLCFPQNFSIPQDISLKQTYKLLGNSINVFVVSALLSLMT